MAAQRQSDPPLRPARPTTPLTADTYGAQRMRQRAITPSTCIETWEPCQRCHETGTIEQGRPHCRIHQHTFAPDEVRGGRADWRGKLPCGHRLDDASTIYVNAPCPDCDGAGGHESYVSVVDFLTWLMDRFEEQFARISQAVTAIQRRTQP